MALRSLVVALLFLGRARSASLELAVNGAANRSDACAYDLVHVTWRAEPSAAPTARSRF